MSFAEGSILCDMGMISGYSKGKKVHETTNVKIDFSLENLDMSELKGR